MRRLFDSPLASYLPPLILWLLALGYLVVARGYDEQSRMMPLLIGRAMLALTTIDLVSRSRTSVGKALLRWLNPAALAAPPLRSEPLIRKETGYVLWIATLVAGLIWLGMFVAVPVFLFVSLAFVGRRGFAQSILLTIAVSAGAWALFALALHLSLFPGTIFGGQL